MKKNMKKNKLLSIRDDWYGLVFTLVIYFLGWISIPTIANISDGLEPRNNFVKLLFNLYNKSNEVYIIITLILCIVLTYTIYYITKLISKNAYENCYSKEEIQKEYATFLNDADSVYIFGGKLNFLIQSEEQFKRIEYLGEKCKIICEDISRSSDEAKEKYNKLINKNIDIRSYSEEITNNIKNFRGQIKFNNDGVIKSLFVSRNIDGEGKETFEKINLPNQYLNQMLLENFNAIFKEGRNPMIKYIVLDLGGVYFDGDFSSDFLEPVNNRLSQNIPIEREQKLVLDDELNLGNIDIIRYIEKKICRDLNREERDFVLNKWKSTWSPNPKMRELVKELKDNGYTVTVISNLDKENGNMYRDRGDFDIFSNELFLSYEYKLLKPNEEFFLKICEKYTIKPYEILFIDDHERNISVANKLGINTIKFSITSDPELENLYKQLAHKNIKFKKDED